MAKIQQETKRKWFIRKETIYDKKKFDEMDYKNAMEIIHLKDFFGTYAEAKAEERKLHEELGSPKNVIFYASVFETKEIKRPEEKIKNKNEIRNTKKKISKSQRSGSNSNKMCF